MAKQVEIALAFQWFITDATEGFQRAERARNSANNTEPLTILVIKSLFALRMLSVALTHMVRFGYFPFDPGTDGDGLAQLFSLARAILLFVKLTDVVHFESMWSFLAS